MNQPSPNDSPSLPLFDTLAVVGVGLLGGSVARTAKERGLVRRVIGVGRNAARLDGARRAGVQRVRTGVGSGRGGAPQRGATGVRRGLLGCDRASRVSELPRPTNNAGGVSPRRRVPLVAQTVAAG